MDLRQPTTESETGKKGFFERKRNRVVAATLATVIGVSALAGCESSANAQGPTSTVTHSAEVTPGASQTPTPVESTPAPVETEVPIEKMTIPEGLKKYEAMSAEEFDKLPVQERLPYISWLTRDTEQIADLWYKTTGDPLDKYPGPITETSSNDAIVMANSYTYRAAFVTHFNLNGINGSSVLYDVNTAKKILSGAYVNGQSPDLQVWNHTADDVYSKSEIPNPVEAIKVGGLLHSTVESTSSTNTTETQDGVTYTTRTITEQMGGSTKVLDVTYAYVTYKDYLGKDAGAFVELNHKAN